MTVFLLWEGIPYEGDELHGVYIEFWKADEERAELERKSVGVGAIYGATNDNYYIEEHETK